MDFERNIYCIGGIPFDAVTSQDAVYSIRSIILTRQECFLSTPNLNFLISCQSDKEFQESVINSDLSIADGMPIIWIAKLLRLPVSERVAGSTLFDILGQSEGTERPIKVFFFGGEAGVANRACQRLKVSHPNFQCAGFIDPGFVSVADMSKPEYIEKINLSAVDFLVVSLGAKKGQQWIEKNRHQFKVPVISHLGAVVNFVAGAVNRSPLMMQRLGLEWLWRIKEEPALWKRYWGDGVGFIRLLITRVLPYAVWLRLKSKKIMQLSSLPPEVEIIEKPESLHLKLSGSFSAGDFENLRTAFQDLAFDRRDVILDCQGVQYIDASFIGLLQLFAQQLSLSENSLEIINLSTALQRVFNWCGVSYLTGKV